MISHSSRRLWVPPSVAGPVTLDYVRDGGPAVWAGPANPHHVLLFNSSGLDWLSAVDYSPVLYNGAAWKTGTDGGLDLPQATDGLPNADFGAFVGLRFNRDPGAGPWSTVLVFSHAPVSTINYPLCIFAEDSWNRLNWVGNNQYLAFQQTGAAAWSVDQFASPQKATIGIRFDPALPFGTRERCYTNGVKEVTPTANLYNLAYVLGFGNGGVPPSLFDERCRCTVHGFFTWDYEITEQEMLDITANPDSLFAAA